MTPLPVTAVSNTVTSNMYYEFHIPLGLYNAVRDLLAQQVDSPNTPNPITDASVSREWFSQPRPATQGSVPKPTFLYATGTAYMFDIFGHGVFQVGGGGSNATPGLDGTIYEWDGAPANDPFYRMLDSSLWTSKRVQFADAGLPMINSLNEGVRQTINMINDTPGAFALGGYSQGAAVMSAVLKKIQHGSLSHRKADLIAGVTFGNPCREIGHLWPGANPVGGWDSPNTSSHGCFPLDYRLQGTPSLWWDFANENEIITTISDTLTGSKWVDMVGVFLNGFGGKDMAAFIAANLSKLPWDVFADVVSMLQTVVGGVGASGHMAYPSEPPPGDPQNGKTSYQIALEMLRDVGTKYKEARTAANKTEVLQVNFKLPMPINDLAFQAVQVPAQVDVWYQDRQGNWRAVLDENRNAVGVTLSSSTAENWYSYHAYTAPTVAKAVQFRLTRIPEIAMGTRPYCVGLRNILMRRNIYDRSSGIRATTITEDALGNVVTTYLKDWDAPKAIDNNPDTFWKSEAQPTADAVVYLVLDVRNPDGTPQLIDTLYIDPVYTSSALNIYYTNDEPDGVTLKPSPISVSPTTESNVRWQAGRGLWDISTGSETSEFTAPFKIGPLVKKNCWIGVQWTPDFTATSPPGQNPVLFEVIPDSPQPGQFWPRLYYDVGNLGYGHIVLEFTNGTDSKIFSAPLSPPLIQNESLNIVAGWAYDVPGSSIYISVTSKGQEIGSYYAPTTLTLPELINMSGRISFSQIRGLLTSQVVKLEAWATSSGSFLANPVTYVDPDPITPDASGQVTSSSLDNSIFSCDWTSQRYPVGGSSPSMHVDRRWTPIWRDYITQRGKLFFPRQTSCKYLKLEFTKLTAEPYPIYDTGIQVSYETFPVSVYADVTTTTTTTTTTPGTTSQTTTTPTSSTVHTPGAIEQIAGSINGAVNAIGGAVNGLLGSIGNLVGGIASVNWLDPTSVNAAVQASSTSTVSPVTAMTGAANTTGSLPNTLSTALGQSTGATSSGTGIALRGETTSTLVARRTALNPVTLAGQTVNQMVSTMPNQGLGQTVSTPIATAISKTFAPTIPSPGVSSVTPAQGSDYWLFPGGLLKMPAAILNGIYMGLATGLFGTNQVVNGSTSSTIIIPTNTTSVQTTATTQRLRFDTTETHVYRKLVVTRTAAIGYFAGLREVAAYSTTYIDYEDPLSFDFKVYDPSQWHFENVKALTSGAVTTAGTTYKTDLDTAIDIEAWNPTGDWSWDGTQDNYSGNRVGSAKVILDGNDAALESKAFFAVEGLDQVVIAASVKYKGASPLNLAPNPSFEDPSFYLGGNGFEYSEDVQRTGSLSLKAVATSGTPTAFLNADTTDYLFFDAAPDDEYYLEIWVYGAKTNTQTTGGSGAIRIGMNSFQSDNTYIASEYVSLEAKSNLNGRWTKLSGTVTMPASTGKCIPYVQVTSAATAGEVYYFDTVMVRKVGDSQFIMDIEKFDIHGESLGYTPLTQVSSELPTILDGPTGSTNGVTFQHLMGTYTAPDDVAGISVRFRITNMAAGQFWIAEVSAEPKNGSRGYLHDRFITFSTFSKVVCELRDSGMRRSDGMWARMDPLNTNIDKGQLAWYTSPTTMPPGMWGDQFAEWADQNVSWGNARATVAIWIDPDRQYKGNRALHFRRAAGAGSAGVRVVQHTNYLPGALCRIGCVFYKPVQDGNVITLRLRRVSDGVYIHEEVIEDPAIGQWYTYQSDFFELPDSLDQVYIVEIDLTGTFEDDLYVSDLYTEVSQIRYFMRLGGVSNPDAVNLDVTELAYTPSNAIVTCTQPTNEVSLDVVLLTNRAVAYGCTLTPMYLQ